MCSSSKTQNAFSSKILSHGFIWICCHPFLVAFLDMFFSLIQLKQVYFGCVLKRMYSDKNLAKTVTSLLTLLKKPHFFWWREGGSTIIV